MCALFGSSMWDGQRQCGGVGGPGIPGRPHLNPSASMIWIRFDGSARKHSQPTGRCPEGTPLRQFDDRASRRETQTPLVVETNVHYPTDTGLLWGGLQSGCNREAGSRTSGHFILIQEAVMLVDGAQTTWPPGVDSR